MKEVKFCISCCGKCPFIRYKKDKHNNRYAYYCKYISEFINNDVDVTNYITQDCRLKDC